MPPLPSGIEAALLDSGFSGTELLVLQRLLEDDALTLRQIAQKTGKSTGVLDLGTKKLLKKGIVHKEDINHTPKYAMSSLQAITAWIQQDTKEKQEILRRRHESIESFLSSLTLQKQRPDLQHFVGEEGMKQAYMDLLASGVELLQYMPASYKEEEDPLREFRIHYFRARKQREIFTRILMPDEPLGRRHQSRDVFEFRKTQLVRSLPIPFEKIIVGNTVACFNHEKMTACFINYPALAEAERGQFEHLWNSQQGMSLEKQPQQTVKLPESIPNKTRLISDLRKFFLSRSAVMSFVGIALLASSATALLYRYNVYLNTQRISEKAMAIAATGALQFEEKDLQELHTLKDVKKPQYSKVIAQLNAIRHQNKDVDYVYIFRNTGDPSIFVFVADADSLDPAVPVDVNADQILDEKDEGVFPGQSYDIATFPTMKKTMYEGETMADTGIDQWVEFVSGHAAIPTEGAEKYIIGVDIFTTRVGELTRSTFAPAGVFASIMIVMIFVRLIAMYPYLLSVKMK